MIALCKFFPFNVLVGKRLDHTNAGQGILQAGVDVANLAAVVKESLLHPFILADGKDQHADDQDGQRDGEPPVDQEQEDKGSDDLDQGNEQVFRAVVGEFGDVEEVGDQFAHHLSGIVLVIVGEG